MPHELLFSRLPEVARKETCIVQVLNHPSLADLSAAPAVRKWFAKFRRK